MTHKSQDISVICEPIQPASSMPAGIFYDRHLPFMGPLDDGDYLVDTFGKDTLYPDPLDSLHACNDVLAPIFLFHRIIRPLGHGVRQDDGEFIPDHLMDADLTLDQSMILICLLVILMGPF